MPLSEHDTSSASLASREPLLRRRNPLTSRVSLLADGDSDHVQRTSLSSTADAAQREFDATTHADLPELPRSVIFIFGVALFAIFVGVLHVDADALRASVGWPGTVGALLSLVIQPLATLVEHIQVSTVPLHVLASRHTPAFPLLHVPISVRCWFRLLRLHQSRCAGSRLVSCVPFFVRPVR